jgi:ketosteroid isomerase-like protein
VEQKAATFVEAMRGADPAGAAELYEQEAVLLVPFMDPVLGRAAIQAFWLSGIEMGLEAISFQAHGESGAAGLRCEVGTYTAKMAGAEGALPGRGVYAVISRLDKDGQWKWLVHLLS